MVFVTDAPVLDQYLGQRRSTGKAAMAILPSVDSTIPPIQESARPLGLVGQHYSAHRDVEQTAWPAKSPRKDREDLFVRLTQSHSKFRLVLHARPRIGPLANLLFFDDTNQPIPESDPPSTPEGSSDFFSPYVRRGLGPKKLLRRSHALPSLGPCRLRSNIRQNFA